MWTIIGIGKLFSKEISKFAYALVWIALMINLIGRHFGVY
jgi:hypothetical protein